MKKNCSIFFLLLCVLLIVFFISCERNKAEWKGTIEKVEGVTVVKNPIEPIFTDKIIEFEENLSIGEDSGVDYLVFRDKLDAAVDKEGNIFILDIGNQRFLKFNNKGEFIWEAGRKGQGPGEFRSRPSQYSYSIELTPSENIAIKDGKLIHLFDKEGNYLRTLTIDKRIWAFNYLPDGRLLVSLGLINKIGNSAAYYTNDGEFINEFPDEYIYDTIEAGMGIECGARYIAKLDRIYVSLPGPYEIRECNLEGKLLRKIRRELKIESPFVKTTNQGTSWQTSDVSGPCFVGPDGMIVNFVTLVEEKEEQKRKIGEREVTVPILGFKKFLDFFNEKGQFLGSFTLKGKELILIDSEGNFYFSQENPFPKIIRAKLTSEVE